MVLRHDSNDPISGPDRPPRHPLPWRCRVSSGWWVIQVEGQGALAPVCRDRRVPGHVLEITEHPWMSRVIPQFESWEAERLDAEHGCAVADPTEEGRLELPPGCGVLWDRDHGKVRAVGSHRIGPPSLGLHVDLGVLADIQPHLHHGCPNHYVRRS